MNVPTRFAASLEQLALALDTTEQWPTDHRADRFALPDPSPEDLHTLDGRALRTVVNTLVPPVASHVGYPIPLFQSELNKAIGLPRGRAGATDDQLRTAIGLLRHWLQTPAEFPSAQRTTP
ncbi:hypothetical protein OG948_01595 [Embleya sp. NBC_00888]|uniref:hypothetical protein n=1 Tax=Embleya sp. NBC_00888 TaxID=2975960 RepID=UPI0038648612|nr:hypothetical protein OG948_01595 [Embleya sp. NBC_00888]